MKRTCITGLLLAGFFWTGLWGQAPKALPDLTGFGKMWTFEHIPLSYFQEKYKFSPGEEWLRKVRMSSLQFSTFCSASFVSADGLILTNHHCSRGEIGEVMQAGEDFDLTGFYAESLEDERRVPDLFVRQLSKLADITEAITQRMKSLPAGTETNRARGRIIEELIGEYSTAPGWEGLEIEPVEYYSGVKVSLYGYKKYDDIRLVCIPELALGYFGGEPDNFAYPRYSLDFTIWRAYENDKPANTADHFFRFNTDGFSENDLVFITGHPGSTERYRTMAQYEFDRDYRYKALYTFIRNRLDIFNREYTETQDRDLQELIFNFSNSLEAFGGILKGMKDEGLMQRKQMVEDHLRNAALAREGSTDYWSELERLYQQMKGVYPEYQFLRPTPFSGATLSLAYQVSDYLMALEDDASEDERKEMKEMIMSSAAGLEDPFEYDYLGMLLEEISSFAEKDDDYVDRILKGQSPAVAAKNILDRTVFRNEKKLGKLLDKKPEKIRDREDPIIGFSELIVPEFIAASMILSRDVARRQELETKIAQTMFEVFGLRLPPDATFTLRLQDGTVKGYEYNGTYAPYKTTYYGMYDRFHSFDKAYPFSLPERWQNPPPELLSQPLTFVSSTDVIGGNSGSPVFNRDLEFVGLVFDGNAESLPGNFIFDEDYNRTISVHAAGIVAALRYIIGADRILEELGTR